MNYIFYFLIVSSIIIGAVNGKLPEVVNSILVGAETSVKIAFSLIGIMAFWLGIMKIAEKSGIVEFISKLIKPITKWMFNDIPENSPAIGDIAMSFSANALGLTNAATPIGIKAMEEMQKTNSYKDSATNSMCMFLGMNTAGFQLVPATVIAVLIGIGYKNPTEIIAPTLLVTSIAFISAIFIAKALEKIWPSPKKQMNREKNIKTEDANSDFIDKGDETDCSAEICNQQPDFHVVSPPLNNDIGGEK